jgi:hypothetical protein
MPPDATKNSITMCAHKMYFILVLATLEYAVYFASNNHFFQGDTIHWFYARHKTLHDFLAGFFSLDSGGWYRPLTNGSVQSLLFPVFGFTPAGYRVVQYALFLAATIAVFKLAGLLSERKLAASLAALYFSLHTVNAYTTYDLAFIPEIVYALFYVCAVFFYLKRRTMIALLCFVASLCSKEAAITLPATLLAVEVISNRKPVLRALADLRAYLVVAGVYLLFVVGYLGVQRSAFQAMINKDAQASYRFALDKTIAENADVAATWAFNIPRGWSTESRGINDASLRFLKGFRILIAILAVWLVFKPERKVLFTALAMFVIALLPALPLAGHFLPYYLFLPLAGFSIAIGIILDAAYVEAASWSRPAARVALPALLTILFVICIVSVRRDARNNRMLGRSSTLALNSLRDLQEAHPSLTPNTTIYISNAEEPDLNWDTSQGTLFKLAYGDETIDTKYWSWGEVITSTAIERGPLIVMKYGNSHLTDITDDFLAASEPPVNYRSVAENQLALDPPVVTAGQTYRLKLRGIENTEASIRYTVNGSPVRVFSVHLDENGEAKFRISEASEKGLYHFVGFQVAGTPEWVQAAGTIRVN